MPWFSAFVIYAFSWFIALLAILPLRLTTQGEAGEVVPGTPSSAPSSVNMGRRLIVTTIVGTIVWACICAVILSGVFTVDNIDVLNHWMNG